MRPRRMGMILGIPIVFLAAVVAWNGSGGSERRKAGKPSAAAPAAKAPLSIAVEESVSLSPDKFVPLLDEAMRMDRGRDKVKALRDLAVRTGKGEILAPLVRAMMSSGEPQDIFEALKGLYLALDPSLLEPVDRAMQQLSPPAYFSFLVGATTPTLPSVPHQVHAVDQIHRLATEGGYPRPALVSSLGYTALPSPNREVRERALQALEEVGDRSSVTALERQRERETDDEIARRTGELIGSLRGR